MEGLSMSETKQLAEFVANLSFDDLPIEVVERIKFLIMDTVGISIRAMHDSESTPSLLAVVENVFLATLNEGISTLERALE